jgi:hypothetical protein
MRNPRTARLLIVFLVVIVAVMIFRCVTRQPSYNGKTAAFWLGKIASRRDEEDAVAAFRAMGTPGVLFLTDQIQIHHDTRFQWMIVNALYHSHVRAFQSFGTNIADGLNRQQFTPNLASDAYAKFLVCRALANIGPAASGAIAALKAAPPPGKVSIKGLVVGLQPEWFQAGAAAALARIHPEDAANLSPLLTKLAGICGPDSERQPEISITIKIAMWRLKMEKEPPIRECMFPGDSAPYYDVVPLLGDIGPAAKPAIPYLTKILNSDHYFGMGMRRAAAAAIRRIDPEQAAKLHLPGILGLP